MGAGQVGFAALRSAWRRVTWPVLADLLRHAPARSFAVAGHVYPQFVHPYNSTWRNERAVEVPLAIAAVARARSGRILEIGNVLSHYTLVEHDIVDKFEAAPGVRNVDVLEVPPDGSYDLVVSISTLEHVGWDDLPRNPSRLDAAVHHLRTLLAPGGCALVTLPLGYNNHLDALLATDDHPFDELRAVHRSGRRTWTEVPLSALRGVQYGQPYPGANGLVVASLRQPKYHY